MKTATQRLLASFQARRVMLLDHLPRHNPAEAIRRLADMRHDIARGLKAKRAL